MVDLGALILPKLVDLMLPKQALGCCHLWQLLDDSPEVAKTGSPQGCLVVAIFGNFVKKLPKMATSKQPISCQNWVPRFEPLQLSGCEFKSCPLASLVPRLSTSHTTNSGKPVYEAAH